MKLRVSLELYGSLKEASKNYGLPVADIVRRACRRWDRIAKKQSVVLSNIPKTSTYKGPVIWLDIPPELLGDKTPEDLRLIIDWYLQQHTYQERKLYIDKTLKEGRDYVVTNNE